MDVVSRAAVPNVPGPSVPPAADGELAHCSDPPSRSAAASSGRRSSLAVAALSACGGRGRQVSVQGSRAQPEEGPDDGVM